MAKIDIRDSIPFGRKVVFDTFRDKLTELVPYLPTVASITVEKREEVDADTTKLLNVWKAKDEDIPKVAQAFIKPEMLQWNDYATWHNDTWTCDWTMKVGFLTDAVSCSGTTTYVEKGDNQTEVIMKGELKVDASKIPGVPRLLAGKVGDAVESFVVRMITPNLTQVNRGLEQYLSK